MPETINRYPYALNNAVNIVDPSGLCGICNWAEDRADDLKDEAEDFVDDVGNAVDRADRFLRSHPEIVTGVQVVSGAGVQTFCYRPISPVLCGVSGAFYGGSSYLKWRYAGSDPERYFGVASAIVGGVKAPRYVTLIPNILLRTASQPVSPAYSPGVRDGKEAPFQYPEQFFIVRQITIPSIQDRVVGSHGYGFGGPFLP
jgi:hypothetical protein